MTSPPSETAPRWFRALLIAAGLTVWFWTQSLIGSRALPAGSIHDGLHTLLGPIHDYLYSHPAAANALLIASSALIDGLGLFLFAKTVFGRSLRPLLGLVLLLGMRQACQFLCVLPPPEQMIWRYPGFPSALVTYGVANDFFFSGHVAMAVFGAIELARSGGRGMIPLGILIVLFEAAAVLALRAHYTMDVFAGAVAALLTACLMPRLAPPCDRFLAGFFNRQ